MAKSKFIRLDKNFDESKLFLELTVGICSNGLGHGKDFLKDYKGKKQKIILQGAFI